MGRFGIFLRILEAAWKIIPTGIVVAEKIGGLLLPGQKSGAQKFQALMAAVKASIQALEVVLGKELVDEGKLMDGLGDIVNGAVKIWNAIRETPSA